MKLVSDTYNKMLYFVEALNCINKAGQTSVNERNRTRKIKIKAKKRTTRRKETRSRKLGKLGNRIRRGSGN